MRLPPYLKILGAFCLGLILVGVWGISRQSPQRKTPFGVPFEKIGRIHLARGGNSILLQRNGVEWQVQGSSDPKKYPAEAVAVVQLADALHGFVVEDLISEREDRLAEYALDDATRLHIVCQNASGEPFAEGYFGKPTADYSQMYFRSPKKPGVYLAKNVNPERFQSSVNAWRSKKILVVSASDISAIAVHTASFAYQLTQVQSSSGTTESSWLVDGKPANNERAIRIVNALISLQADGFADSPQDAIDPATLTEAEMHLTLHGRERVLRFGKLDPKTDMIPLQVQGEEFVYRILRAKGESLIPKPAELRPAK